MEQLSILTNPERLFSYQIPNDLDKQKELVLFLEQVKDEISNRVFYIQGKILHMNQDTGLWKDRGYQTFEEYVKKEFNFSRSYAYQLIASYKFTDEHKERLMPMMKSVSEPFVRTILKSSGEDSEEKEKEFQLEVLKELKEKIEEETVHDEAKNEEYIPELKPQAVKTICEKIKIERMEKANAFKDKPVYEIGDIVLVNIKSNLEPEIKKAINGSLVQIYAYGNTFRRDPITEELIYDNNGQQCPEYYFVQTWDGAKQVPPSTEGQEWIDLIIKYYDCEQSDDRISDSFEICSDLYKQMLELSIEKPDGRDIYPKNQVLQDLIEKGLKYDNLLLENEKLKSLGEF